MTFKNKRKCRLYVNGCNTACYPRNGNLVNIWCSGLEERVFRYQHIVNRKWIINYVPVWDSADSLSHSTGFCFDSLLRINFNAFFFSLLNIVLPSIMVTPTDITPSSWFLEVFTRQWHRCLFCATFVYSNDRCSTAWLFFVAYQP